MTTWILTPNMPNPFTGFENPVIGWQLTLAAALDTLTGCMTVYAAGWHPQLTILPTSQPTAPIWQLNLIRGKDLVTVNDTDWLAFDGNNVWAMPQATVEAGYTVTAE
jgi:hypothetical protein